MAKKVAKKAVKKTAKKVVKKVLDSTTIDEKLVAEYKENKTLIDTILCYVKCYGGYVLAVGAGCSFGVNFKLGLALFLVAAGWAYWQVCCCKPCKDGKDACCSENSCK
tara:strand:+ start:246 stop:569 length:324 start_codon:yes stop_codon:yes gene_type:complete